MLLTSTLRILFVGFLAKLERFHHFLSKFQGTGEQLSGAGKFCCLLISICLTKFIVSCRYALSPQTVLSFSLNNTAIFLLGHFVNVDC